MLGYELAQIDCSLEAGESIHKPVHADNRPRIEAACKQADRPYRLTWLQGDASESWLLLEVPPKPPKQSDLSGASGPPSP